MTAELRAQEEMLADRAQRQLNARAYSARWTEATGAHLLVVDPRGDNTDLRAAMISRGVHTTWVGSTLDGLIEFGRTNPAAIIITPDASGISATEFVSKVSESSSAFVIAALDIGDATDAGRLILAGAGAVVTRPYTAEAVWEVLQRYRRSLDDHARVSFGPIELDARAYIVRVNGERVADLPLKEFELLRTLMYRAPEVLSDDELRASLWGSEVGGPTDNTIAVHAARVRNRLKGVARVRRVRGRGYALTLD
jgi:two-component system, OmpR family, response regulator